MDAALLPDGFSSVTDPASQVGSEPLHHDCSADTVPQFVFVPLLWPTTLDDKGFTTWLSAMHFLTTKNQASNLPNQHSLFDAANWSAPGPGHIILSQLGHEAIGFSTATVKLNPSARMPKCRVAWCLPFINDACLSCLWTVCLSLPDTSSGPQQHTQPAHGATEALHVDKAAHHIRHTHHTLQEGLHSSFLMGHNFLLLFLRTLSHDAEHSLVYKCLLSLLHLFHSPRVQMIASCYTHVPNVRKTYLIPDTYLVLRVDVTKYR
eukprot:jgi/Psemu1/7581/gm1.7581_g